MTEIAYRRVPPSDAAAAADIHRIAGALIPGYDTSLHTPAEFHRLYRDRVLVEGPVWGAYEADRLVGFVALLDGWIDHMYVTPERHRRGIASALVTIAQGEQDDLQLYTFQSNAAGRALYERHGFRVEEWLDGSQNEEGMPAVRYRWRRATPGG